jgi:urea transport system substrate-binding protein
MSVDSDTNYDFIDEWIDYTGKEDAVTNDPMEAHYIGFNMWMEAARKAGSVEVDAVKDAIIGVSVPNLTGGYATMMPNHHITKPVLIGEIQDNGQFSVVWQTPSTVAGDAWSDYLEGSKDLISDWRKPMECGNYNVVTHSCGAQQSVAAQ